MRRPDILAHEAELGFELRLGQEVRKVGIGLDHRDVLRRQSGEIPLDHACVMSVDNLAPATRACRSQGAVSAGASCAASRWLPVTIDNAGQQRGQSPRQNDPDARRRALS